MFFVKIEEKRLLDIREFRLRIKIRERAYELANIIETGWQQRLRCKWLASGDKNTRFFQAYASARMRKNTVTSLEHEGSTITNETLIRQAFVNNLRDTLGVQGNSIPFELGVLYNSVIPLTELVISFTESEMQGVVRQLAKKKAMGPDGLLNKFLQLYWDEIKEEIMTMISRFF